MVSTFYSVKAPFSFRISNLFSIDLLQYTDFFSRIDWIMRCEMSLFSSLEKFYRQKLKCFISEVFDKTDSKKLTHSEKCH